MRGWESYTMVIVQRAIKDKTPSGGQKKEMRGKKAYERGSEPTLPGIGEKKVQVKPTRGGNSKMIGNRFETANVLDPKTKKVTKSPITLVEGNAANRHYARRNILTKGAIIETEAGKAKITNRPGQEAVVNAVLI
jgi:small subunit ribosomal protein S8e